MKEVIYSDFYKGEGKSSRDSTKYDSITGVDIHSTPGIVYPSPAMEKESGATVTELCVAVATEESNGNLYWFSSSSGKVWRRSSDGTWSLFKTLSSMSGILGACFYHGQVFFATATKLGRYNISTNTWYENEQTFTRGDTKYKPMVVQNLTLYIGDQDYIASVSWNGSTFVFNANALDIPYEQRASTLGRWKGSLIVGTASRTTEYNAMVLVWDTYSDSWVYEDYVPEKSVNTIIPSDNNLYMQCGDSGNVYFYDGTQLVRDKVLRGEDNSSTYLPYGGHQCATQYKGQALFFGYQGIWSIGSFDNELPRSIHKMYVSPEAAGSVRGAIVIVGPWLFISYSGSLGVGVSRNSINTYYNGYVATPVAFGDYQNVEVKYDSLPTGTSLTIQTKVNGGTWTTKTTIYDTIRKVAYFDGGLGDVSTLQVLVYLNASGATYPIIDYIRIW